MSDKLSQERLEEIAREPLTTSPCDVLALADELIEAREWMNNAELALNGFPTKD